jgi:hypothetical protein
MKTKYKFSSSFGVVTIAFIFGLALYPNIASSSIDVTFTDQASEVGFGLVQRSQCPAFFDDNGDGFEDLYLAAGGFASSDNIFYRSRGDFTFEVATDELGLNDPGPSTQIIAADFNNDGLTDLYVTNHSYQVVTNHMFYRQATGNYLDVTDLTGTGNAYESHNSMAFDYDSDGWLDIYVSSANHAALEPNALYHNNGDGTFTDVAGILGLTLADDFGQGSCAGDYDNDGDPDLFITHEYTPNKLYRNDNGIFTDVSADAGIEVDSYSKAAYFEDYDNDGWLDLYIVNRGGNDYLLRNNGDGTFDDVTTEAGIVATHQGRTLSWADFDNDGYLDVFVSNNSLSNDVLWHNQGDGTFIDVTTTVGIEDFAFSDGIGIGDPNGDGFMDVYLSNTDVMDRFYVNSGNQNHWISIQPTGRTSTNRSGVGVRVTVVAGSHRQFREVQAGGGYQSFSSLPVEFGLGAETVVDSVILRWTNGDVEIYTNVTADQRYIAVEDGALYAFSLPDLSISATPLTQPVVIPLNGGNIEYTVDLSNLSGIVQSVDVWTEVRLPDNSSFSPIISRTLDLFPGSISRDLIQSVPATAPEGDYTFYTYMGRLSDQSVWALGSFEFTKTNRGTGSARWLSTCWDGECTECMTSDPILGDRIPRQAEMARISPNPFNPATTVEYALPSAGNVLIDLYNIRGQKVLNLIDGFRQAGTYRVTLDGGPLPSGIYFLHFQTENATQVAKAMLVK